MIKKEVGNKMLRKTFLLVIIVLLGGCSSKDGLYFMTSTGINIEASSDTDAIPTLSLGYKRHEFVRMPKYKDNNYSIMGTVDNNLSFWDGSKISQKFATGKAAEYAALAYKNSQAKDSLKNKIKNKQEYQEKSLKHESYIEPVTESGSKKAEKKEQEMLYLTTSSIFGVDIELGEGNIQQKVIVGYKRSEATFFPVDENEKKIKSVYTDIIIDSRNKNSASSENTIIKQSFATGSAAEILATENADTLFEEHNNNE